MLPKLIHGKENCMGIMDFILNYKRPVPTAEVEGIPIFVDSNFVKSTMFSFCCQNGDGTYEIHMKKDDYENTNKKYVDYIIYHELGHIKLKHFERAYNITYVDGMRVIDHPEFEAEADIYAMRKVGISFSEYKNILNSVIKGSIVNVAKSAIINGYGTKNGHEMKRDNRALNIAANALGSFCSGCNMLFSSGYKKRLYLVKKFDEAAS
jgi:hypothetical protein